MYRHKLAVKDMKYGLYLEKHREGYKWRNVTSAPSEKAKTTSVLWCNVQMNAYNESLGPG